MSVRFSYITSNFFIALFIYFCHKLNFTFFLINESRVDNNRFSKNRTISHAKPSHFPIRPMHASDFILNHRTVDVSQHARSMASSANRDHTCTVTRDGRLPVPPSEMSRRRC